MQENTMRQLITGTVLAVAILAGFIISCSDESSAPNFNRIPSIFNPFSQDAAAGYAAWMSASVTDNEWFVYTKTDRSAMAYQTFNDFRDCAAVFTTPSFDRVHPAAVRFDGHDLMFTDNTKYYSLMQGTLDFDMDGSSYIWKVDSSQDFPSILDTIQSPSSRVSITSHSVYDSVSKANDMVVNWSPSGSQDNVVIIALTGTDTTASSIVSFMDAADDNGSYTIPSSVLSGLDDQKMTLSVSRGKYIIGEMQDGRKYLISIYSQNNIDLRLLN